MRIRSARFIIASLAIAMLFMSSTPAELAAKHTRSGDEYVKQEKYREAVIEYKNAAKADPKDAALRYKLANAALESRDIRTAFQEFQKVVELDPNNFEAKEKLGEIYVAAGRRPTLRRSRTTSSKSRPTAPGGYNKGGS